MIKLQILSSTLDHYLRVPWLNSSKIFADMRTISVKEQRKSPGKAPRSHCSVQPGLTLPRTLFLCVHLNHQYQFSSSHWQQLPKFKTHDSINGAGEELEENSQWQQFCLDINARLRSWSSHFSVGEADVVWLPRDSSEHVCSSQLPPEALPKYPRLMVQREQSFVLHRVTVL